MKKTFTFLFFVSTEYLKEMAIKYAGHIYLNVHYEQVGETSFAEVNWIDCSFTKHRHINWTSKLYEEIQEAAKNNLQSQLEPKPIYEIKPF